MCEYGIMNIKCVNLECANKLSVNMECMNMECVNRLTLYELRKKKKKKKLMLAVLCYRHVLDHNQSCYSVRNYKVTGRYLIRRTAQKEQTR